VTRRWWWRWGRSLRVQLAVLGFVAIYAPLLLVLGVDTVAEEEVTATTTLGGQDVTVTGGASGGAGWTTWTVIALAPVAVALAWWWAGRAVGPLDRVRRVAEEIESSDLSRRIDLPRGPTEVVALAAGFDAMLDRLERAVTTQAALIEEASHELRTPLAVVLTSADVALSHPDPTLEEHRAALERSRAAALRMRSTVEDLLVEARGRARSLDRQPVDLVALVRTVTAEVAVVAAAAGVEVVVEGPDALPGAVDEASVRRAVANLVDNAVRHGPAGSTVEVAVAAVDGTAVVTVTDHGPGIAPDQQDLVFERFWRGPGTAAGAGLGLPIARQVARAHGGDVSLRSPGLAGDGSTFTLRLHL